MIGTITTLALLGGGAWLVKKKLDKSDHGVLTPARELVFKSHMMLQEYEPDQLRKVATAFETVGLRSYGKLLRKKADNAEIPADLKAKREDAFRRAMASKDPNRVEAVADAFEGQGAFLSATHLRTVAKGLRAAAGVHVEASPIEPKEEPKPTEAAPAASAASSATTPQPPTPHVAPPVAPVAPTAVAHGDVSHPHGVNGIATGVDESQTGTLEEGSF